MGTVISSEVEKRFERELRWPTVKDIPDFPARSFEEVKEKVKSNDLSVGIDYTVANYAAPAIHGPSYKPIFCVWVNMPFVLAILAIVLSVTLGNYFLLLAIPLVFMSEFLSNPYNPLSKLFGKVTFFLSLYFLHALSTGQETIAYLVAFFVVNFWSNRGFYRHNQSKLREAALSSEKIFIYLYQTGSLGLRENRTRKTYWNNNQQRG